MKDEIVKFRVSKQEKEDLNSIISQLGEKSISDFFRNIINDLSSLMLYKGSSISELDLLLEKYSLDLNDKSLNIMQKHSVKQRINLLNQFKKELKDSTH